MAGAEPASGNVGDSGSTLPGRSHGAVRLAPLDPEQLRRVLEQVTRAQPPPSTLPAAARRLRDGAQQAQRGPGAEAPRLLTPQVRRRAGWRGRSWPLRTAFGAWVVCAQLCAPGPPRGVLLPPLRSQPCSKPLGAWPALQQLVLPSASMGR